MALTTTSWNLRWLAHSRLTRLALIASFLATQVFPLEAQAAPAPTEYRVFAAREGRWSASDWTGSVQLPDPARESTLVLVSAEKDGWWYRGRDGSLSRSIVGRDRRTSGVVTLSPARIVSVGIDADRDGHLDLLVSGDRELRQKMLMVNQAHQALLTRLRAGFNPLCDATEAPARDLAAVAGSRDMASIGLSVAGGRGGDGAGAVSPEGVRASADQRGSMPGCGVDGGGSVGSLSPRGSARAVQTGEAGLDLDCSESGPVTTRPDMGQVMDEPITDALIDMAVGIVIGELIGGPAGAFIGAFIGASSANKAGRANERPPLPDGFSYPRRTSDGRIVMESPAPPRPITDRVIEEASEALFGNPASPAPRDPEPGAPRTSPDEPETVPAEPSRSSGSGTPPRPDRGEQPPVDPANPTGPATQQAMKDLCERKQRAAAEWDQRLNPSRYRNPAETDCDDPVVNPNPVKSRRMLAGAGSAPITCGSKAESTGGSEGGRGAGLVPPKRDCGSTEMPGPDGSCRGRLGGALSGGHQGSAGVALGTLVGIDLCNPLLCTPPER
jgi:hypothetical protein